MNPSYFIWLDMEMSGLEPKTDTILEVAVILTDNELNIVAEGPDLVVRQESKLFVTMDQWNQTHHSQSGLWKKVVESNISMAQAEQMVLQFLQKYVPRRGGYLAGNSIWQDRRFIIEHMPELNNYLHYRMIDVTTVKILSKYWYPDLNFMKKNAHRALDDIKESIEELKFYKSHILK